jgi:hypothetical protein
MFKRTEWCNEMSNESEMLHIALRCHTRSMSKFKDEMTKQMSCQWPFNNTYIYPLTQP